jgi:hypothetical protein
MAMRKQTSAWPKLRDAALFFCTSDACRFWKNWKIVKPKPIKDREVRITDINVRSALLRVRWNDMPVRRNESSVDASAEPAPARPSLAGLSRTGSLLIGLPSARCAQGFRGRERPGARMYCRAPLAANPKPPARLERSRRSTACAAFLNMTDEGTSNSGFAPGSSAGSAGRSAKVT